MITCEGCGTEVTVEGDNREGTHYYKPVNSKLDGTRFDVPFRCTLCGAIKFPYQAIRDVVFLYPLPKPDKTESGIILPAEEYRGGSARDQMTPPLAVVLSLGRGHVDKKGRLHPTDELGVGDLVYYTKSVPWVMDVEGWDGKKRSIVYCGFQDVQALDDTISTHGERTPDKKETTKL